MKIIFSIWALLCFGGLIFTMYTAGGNFLLSLVGLIPTAITAAFFAILDR